MATVQVKLLGPGYGKPTEGYMYTLGSLEYIHVVLSHPRLLLALCGQEWLPGIVLLPT